MTWLVLEPYPSEKYENSAVGIMNLYGKHVPNHQAVTISLANSSQVRQVRWKLATKKFGTYGGHP